MPDLTVAARMATKLSDVLHIINEFACDIYLKHQ